MRRPPPTSPCSSRDGSLSCSHWTLADLLLDRGACACQPSGNHRLRLLPHLCRLQLWPFPQALARDSAQGLKCYSTLSTSHLPGGANLCGSRPSTRTPGLKARSDEQTSRACTDVYCCSLISVQAPGRTSMSDSWKVVAGTSWRSRPAAVCSILQLLQEL